MNNREKIYLLKDTIYKLYTLEGRSKSYIAKLLGLNRTMMTSIINYEWKFEMNTSKRYLKPSNQKFANKHREFIISRLNNNQSISSIASELCVSRQYISRTIANGDSKIANAIQEYHNRVSKGVEDKKLRLVESSSLQYTKTLDDSVEWRPILHHDGYFISSDGRVASYKKSYNQYVYISMSLNSAVDRYYVKIGKKSYSIHRLVAIHFVDGRSDVKNTVNHKDGNVLNNCADNLEWCTQSENNTHSYRVLHRKVSKKTKNFKKIVLDGKYEFKTIEALAKFLGKSWTQTNRYLTGESKFNRKLEIIN